MSEKDINNLKEMLVDFNEYSTDYTKTRCRELEETIENTLKEIERLKNDIKRITNICNEKIKIIKEVREYAEETIDFVGDVSWVEIPSEDYIKKWQDILDILDKENI